MINLTTAISLSVLTVFSILIVLLRYRTVLFGFTLYSFSFIASASFAGFWFRGLTGRGYTWVTPTHMWVFIYSAFGLIAFAIGVFLAWRPLQKNNGNAIVLAQTFPWLNKQFAVLCLFIGGVSYLSGGYAFRIPTLQAVWSNYFNFLQIGLLIALLCFKQKRDIQTLLFAVIIFLPLTLYQSLISGHIGAAGSFLLQLLLVAAFWNGISLRSIIIAGSGILLLLTLMTGWLSSRDIIRSGSLNHLSMVNRAATFLHEFDYINPLKIDLNVVDFKIFERVDMTHILVAQARYQPHYKSYAYGGTIFPSLAAALVPRFVWPNKPIRLGGSSFVSQYTGMVWGQNTSVGLPYQFELYANGGIWGVILGLFLFGWVTAKLELTLFIGNYSLPHFMGLLTVTNNIAYGSQTIVVLIMGIVAGYIGVFVLGRLLEYVNKSWHFWQNDERAFHEVSVSSKQLSTRRYAPTR